MRLIRYSRKLFLVLFIAANFILRFSNAQVFSFYNYSVVDGLIQSNVKCVVQDKKGNIWLGTDAGLSKFDGKNFQNYFVDDGLTENGVSSLLLDKFGNLWIGHPSGGLTKLHEGKFQAISSDAFPKGKKVVTLFQDSKNNIWISFQDFGVIRVANPDQASTNLAEVTILKNREGLSAYIFDIIETKEHDLYFATDIGLKYFNADSNRFDFLKIRDLEGMQVTRMVQDNNGDLWFGVYLGGSGVLAHYSLQTKAVKIFSLGSFISSLMKDKEGNIWVSTWGSGIARYDQKTQSLLSFNSSNGFNAEKTYCLTQDREGNVLIGSQNNGLYIFKGERFVTYFTSDPAKGDPINSVVAGDSSIIWLGTMHGLVTLNGKENRIESGKTNGAEINILGLAKDKSGNLWVRTSNQKLIQFNTHTNKFTSPDLLNLQLTNLIITSIAIDRKDRLWIGTVGNGLFSYDLSKGKLKNFSVDDGFFGQFLTVNSLFCDDYGNTWIATNGKGLAQFDGTKFTLLEKGNEFSKTTISAMAKDRQGHLWIGTSGEGLHKYDGKTFTDYRMKDGLLSDLISLVIVDRQNNIWIGTNKGLSKLIQKDSTFISYGKSDGFKSVETKPSAACIDAKGNLWFGTVNGLIKYNADADHLNNLETETNITGVKINHTKSLSLIGKPTLLYNENTLTFEYSGICISNPDAVKFKVMLSGAEEQWRPVSKEGSVIYSNLPPGEYTFQVKATNNLGLWNKEPTTFSFKINPPWYSTWWAYVLYILISAILFFTYINMRERKLIKQKTVLEEKVRERTAEVSEKNEELYEKNRDILASIRYAKRIQDAILPPDQFVKKYLPKTFILFKPKDIVSGDFYWLHDKGDKILFAAVDCTGHGVPGAFMSIVGHNHLEQIVAEQGIVQPAAILDALNKGVSETLRQSQSEDNVKDGMDIALCMFDRKTNEFQYAGAFNPLYWIRNGELNEIKADKSPIGYLKVGEQVKYTNHSIQLEKGDTLYIFSDGYADQFGGPQGKKFKYSMLKKTLLETQHMTMEEQGVFLEKTIEEWKGNLEQVDDILLIGTRL